MSLTLAYLRQPILSHIEDSQVAELEDWGRQDSEFVC